MKEWLNDRLRGARESDHIQTTRSQFFIETVNRAKIRAQSTETAKDIGDVDAVAKNAKELGIALSDITWIAALDAKGLSKTSIEELLDAKNRATKHARDISRKDVDNINDMPDYLDFS